MSADAILSNETINIYIYYILYIYIIYIYMCVTMKSLQSGMFSLSFANSPRTKQIMSGLL